MLWNQALPSVDHAKVAIGRAERFELLKARVTELFGEKRARTAFELLELTEMAWHDCYGEVALRRESRPTRDQAVRRLHEGAPCGHRFR